MYDNDYWDVNDEDTVYCFISSIPQAFLGELVKNKNYKGEYIYVHIHITCLFILSSHIYY